MLFDLEEHMRLSAIAITLNRVHEYVWNRETGNSSLVRTSDEKVLVSTALKFLVSVQKGMGEIGGPETIKPKVVYNTNLLIEAMEHKSLRLSRGEFDFLVSSLKKYQSGQISASELTPLRERIGKLAEVLSSYSRTYARTEDSDD